MPPERVASGATAELEKRAIISEKTAEHHRLIAQRLEAIGRPDLAARYRRSAEFYEARAQEIRAKLNRMYSQGYMTGEEYLKWAASIFPDKANYFKAKLTELKQLPQKFDTAMQHTLTALGVVTMRMEPEQTQQLGSAIAEGAAEGYRLALETHDKATAELWKTLLERLAEIRKHASPGFLEQVLNPLSTWVEDLIKNLPDRVPPEAQQYMAVAGRLQDVVWDRLVEWVPDNPYDAWAKAKIITSVFVPAVMGMTLIAKGAELASFWKEHGFQDIADTADRLLGMSAITGMLISAPVAYGFMPWFKRWLDMRYRSHILDQDEADYMFLKGIIPAEYWRYTMEMYGWPDHLIRARELHLKTRLPSPSDIIRFAVREYWRPEISRPLGQWEEFPEELLKWTRKWGYEDWVAWAEWVAHWTLPSVTQGFEMLHRRVITRDELENLLKAQDITPFWREKLIAISYAPFTRVDVRRMFKLGVLNRDQVYSAMLDIGYDPWKAEQMTKFYEVYVSEFEEALEITNTRREQRDLMRATWTALKDEAQKDFIEGAITLAQLVSNLRAIAPFPELADVYVTEAILRRDRERRKRKVERLEEEAEERERALRLTQSRLLDEAKKDYRDGWISKQQLHVNLVALDLTPYEVEVHIAEAELWRKREHNEMLRDIYIDAYRKDVINDIQLKEYLLSIPMELQVVDLVVEREKIRKIPKPRGG